MIKQIFMSFLAVFLPWVVLLINDNPGGALAALAMQATFIGWPLASIWAWRVMHPEKKQKANYSAH